MLHAHEIIPGLWIGDHVAASTREFYLDKSISSVISNPSTANILFDAIDWCGEIINRNIKVKII